MQNMIFVLYPLFCILLPCMLYVLIQTKGFHRRTNFIHMIWVFIFCIMCTLFWKQQESEPFGKSGCILV